MQWELCAATFFCSFVFSDPPSIGGNPVDLPVGYLHFQNVFVFVVLNAAANEEVKHNSGKQSGGVLFLLGKLELWPLQSLGWLIEGTGGCRTCRRLFCSTDSGAAAKKQKTLQLFWFNPLFAASC